jgi:hypothetical protein
VMDWISPFQNREENEMIENSGITHYSCTQLLRDMEVAADSESESGREDEVTSFDDEVMHLPEDLLETGMEINSAQILPVDPFVLSEMKNGSDVCKKSQDNVVSVAEDLDAAKGGWGAYLGGEKTQLEKL